MLVTEPSQIEAYYRALVNRADDHVGVFFAAVKTTGIFCIATCRARKPKFENVEFYTQFKDCLDAGYRPCKICRPTENAHSAPPEIQQAIDWVRNHPKERLTDWQMKQQGLSPEAIRRWFQNNYGMTFQGYQRQLRINAAMQELNSGSSASQTAFSAGYESLSGFGYTFKKVTGGSPASASKVILINRFTTPLGPMFVCATDDGVCLLEFVDRRMLETEFRDLQRAFKAKIIAGENQHTLQAQREISEYFAGTRGYFSVALDTPGSEFQKAVWQMLQTIPVGSTASYAEQAEKIGKPQAVRAVAGANGANRVSIIIPCHRVIGKDGSLTGYGGGLARKQWLLDHERAMAATTPEL
jgi:AraC family transcriptional regulator of adaptative response/methylated-DNA-[protein]-cysteine methyltransferase